MKRTFILIGIATAFAALPAASHEHSAGDHNKMLNYMMNMMDMNGDGLVSTTEHEAGAREMFANADTSQNGYLSREEITAYGTEMRREAGIKTRNKMSDITNPHPRKN